MPDKYTTTGEALAALNLSKPKRETKHVPELNSARWMFDDVTNKAFLLSKLSEDDLATETDLRSALARSYVYVREIQTALVHITKYLDGPRKPRTIRREA